MGTKQATYDLELVKNVNNTAVDDVELGEEPGKNTRGL